MIRPSKLSIEAFDVLRAFVRAEAREKGARVAIDTLPACGTEDVLSELHTAELIDWTPGSADAVLTAVGERFFARYLHRCW